jgi:hypothetical protein
VRSPKRGSTKGAANPTKRIASARFSMCAHGVVSSSSMSGRVAGVSAVLAVILLVPAAVPAQVPARAAPHATKHEAGAEAVLPGFETLDDGSTRLFVDLSAPVSLETKPAKGSIVYVLKGARVARRNNCNPLVTEFFNTPVKTARLVPHGKDLWFVVDVRAPVEPAVSVDPSKEGGATLSIHFPKGDYYRAPEPPPDAFVEPGPPAAAGAPAPSPASSAATPRAAPMNRPRGGGGGGGHSRKHGGGTPSN